MNKTSGMWHILQRLVVVMLRLIFIRVPRLVCSQLPRACRTNDRDKQCLYLFFFTVVIFVTVVYVYTPQQPDMTSIDLSDAHVQDMIKGFKRQMDEQEKLHARQKEIVKKRKAMMESQNLTLQPMQFGANPMRHDTRPNVESHIVDTKVQEKLKGVFRDPGLHGDNGEADDADDFFGNHIESVKGMLKPYDLRGRVTEEFECMTMKVHPETPVCLHPTGVDVHISYHIKTEGVWEGHIVKTFQDILKESPDVAVIDIGANIGVYSLIAANMGHKVLAVEPYIGNIRRLQKAAQMAGVVDKITLLQNAVSDVRDKVTLTIPYDNQGGGTLNDRTSDCSSLDQCIVVPEVQTVLMDDLIWYTNFSSAIMKVDIEGHEHQAFVFASRLLTKIHVPVIIMEWRLLRAYYGAEITVTINKSMVHKMVMFFETMGYVPYSMVTGQRYKSKYWYGWPDDIIWRLEADS